MKNYALALDFGGTKLATAVVELNTGEILGYQKIHTPAEQGADACLQAMLDCSAKSLDCAGYQTHDLNGIGISFGGQVSRDGKTIIRSMHVRGWDNYRLTDEVSRIYGLPTQVLNDGDAAALGEWCYGSHEKSNNFLYTQISTGIGGGMVLNRQLYRGQGLASEVGHIKPMALPGQYHHCACGRDGCIESISSGWALKRDAEELLQNCDNNSLFARMAAENSEVSAKLLIESARQGDARASEIVTNAFRTFAVAISNCIILLDLEEVAIGGGIGNNAWDILYPIMQETFSQMLFDVGDSRVSLHRSALNGMETLLGAARICMA